MYFPPEHIYSIFKSSFLNSHYGYDVVGYPLYLFILVTPRFEKAFSDVIKHMSEIDKITSTFILIPMPKLSEWTRQNFNNRKTFGAMRNFYTVTSNKTKHLSDFEEIMVDNVYRFQKILGLRNDDLPSIVMFESIKSPDSFVLLKSKKGDFEDIITLIGKIYDEIECYLNKYDFLSEYFKLKECLREGWEKHQEKCLIKNWNEDKLQLEKKVNNNGRFRDSAYEELFIHDHLNKIKSKIDEMRIPSVFQHLISEESGIGNDKIVIETRNLHLQKFFDFLNPI